MSRWRLITHGAGHGAWNMGVDEALLASAVRTGRPSLRFYRWQGPWLSLGYGQILEPERLAACGRAGVGVVRRVTGGRAVLHGSDLTYALAAREEQLPPGLTASYELVAGILIRALAALGVEAVASVSPRRRESFPHRFQLGAAAAASRFPGAGFDCFARPAGREICVAGQKLAGSAQRRAQGGILQHGSIRLAPDPPGARRASSLIGAGATSLAELGVDSAPEALQVVCVEAFGRALGGLEAGELTAEERAGADERVRNQRRDSGFAPSGYTPRQPQESPSPTDR
ncbi:MAG: lipoate--protein ligase family protein [Deltaproteobacteria bacterium]|nr:lipoate--protein ligase family protein [Deltaproteobacteria bacterium]